MAPPSGQRGHPRPSCGRPLTARAPCHSIPLAMMTLTLVRKAVRERVDVGTTGLALLLLLLLIPLGGPAI